MHFFGVQGQAGCLFCLAHSARFFWSGHENIQFLSRPFIPKQEAETAAKAKAKGKAKAKVKSTKVKTKTEKKD